jgi:protease-4
MKKENTSSVLIGGILALIIFLAGCGSVNCLIGYWVVSGIGSTLDPEMLHGPGIGVIRIDGVIVSGIQPAPRQQGVVYSEHIADIVKMAGENDNVKALVLRVNSPGGSVVGSNEIYEALLKLEKPIVISMGEMGASGGYYISCAADRIMVNPSTLTGSIGVIAQMPNVTELMDKIGVEVNVIKSGKLKDEGSPFRPMTEEEKAIWQEIIDEAYDQFVSLVAEGRDLPEDKVREIADGRIYTGLQAIELNLADEEGNFPDAVKLAAELGEIKGEPEIIELYEPPAFLESLFMSLPGSSVSLSLEDTIGVDMRPNLQYLYTGP